MERELLVLGILRQQGMHGYQLNDFIEKNLTSCTDMKRATLYALLDRLAAKRWIIETEEQEGNRPPRKVYSVTEEGEIAYQRLLRANLTTHEQALFTDEIGLIFIETLPAQEAVALLEQRKAAMQNKLMEFSNVQAIHQGGARLVVDHQIYHLQSEITWLERLIKELVAG